MNHFTSYPFWINEIACWSDLKSLNGPVGTENRGVAVFTHWDITQLNESTFSKITILGLKIMMKSALKLLSLKSLHVGNYLSLFQVRILLKTTNSVTKIIFFPHRGISKKKVLDHFSPSFLGQKWYIQDTYSILTMLTMVK